MKLPIHSSGVGEKLRLGMHEKTQAMTCFSGPMVATSSDHRASRVHESPMTVTLSSMSISMRTSEA